MLIKTLMRAHQIWSAGAMALLLSISTQAHAQQPVGGLPAPTTKAQNTPTEPNALPPLPAPVFIAPRNVNLAEALKPWPVEQSTGDLADIEVARMLDKLRTPEMVNAAKRFAALSPNLWLAEVLGSAEQVARYPKTVALLTSLQGDVRGINRAANATHAWRRRPAERDLGITPSLPSGQVATSSYPSANASMAFVWADVTAQLSPKNAQAIHEKAEYIAWLRVVGGAHFPSDVVGSRAVAGAVRQALNASPVWLQAFADAKAEWSPPSISTNP
jgi:acid phosphatase (class A)